MKATEHYAPVVLFIMLDKVLLTFDSVDEMVHCQSYWAVLYSGTVCFSILFTLMTVPGHLTYV